MLQAILAVAPINLHGRDDRDQERLADLLGEAVNLLEPGQRLRLLIDNRSVTAHEEMARLATRQRPRSRRQVEYTDRRHAWMEAKLSDARVARTAFYVVVGEQPRQGGGISLGGRGGGSSDAARRDAFRATVEEMGDRLEAMGLDYTVLDGEATRALLASFDSAGNGPSSGDSTGAGAGEGNIAPREMVDALYVPARSDGDGPCHWERTLYALRLPDQTMPGWIARLAALPFQSRVSIDIEGLDQDGEMRRLDGLQTYIAGINDDRLLATGASSVQMGAAQREYRRVIDDMADPSVKTHRVGVYLTVTAPTREALTVAVARGAAALRAARCVVGWGLGDQERLRRATLPRVEDAGHAYRALTGTVGRCFPFTRLSPGHDTGMPLGRTSDKREQFLLDLDADDIATQQVAIAGVPGAGKTVLTLEMALQTYLEGNSVFVSDSSGSYAPLCAFLDGSYITPLDGDTRPCINPWDFMDTRTLVRFHRAILRQADPSASLSWWQAQALGQAIRATKEREAAPCESRLVERLRALDVGGAGRGEERDNLIAGLAEYTGAGNYATLADQPTSPWIDLANPFLVFDTSLLGEATVPGYYIVEALEEWRAGRHGGKRRPDGRAVMECLVIDEGWAVIEADPEYLERIGRTSRHLNRRVIFATQNLSDMIDNPKAAKLFGAIPVIILFNVTDERANQEAGLGWMARTLRLTAREVEQLGGLKTIRGKHAQAFVIIRSERASERRRGRVDIELPPDDIELFKSHKNERDARDAAMAAHGGSLWEAVKATVDGRTTLEPVAPVALPDVALPDGHAAEDDQIPLVREPERDREEAPA